MKWIAIGAFTIVLLSLPHLIGAYITSIFVFILMYSPILMGLALLVGWGGQFSLGQATFFGLGAYISTLLSIQFGISPWLTLVLSAALTGGFAYLLGRPLLSVPGPTIAAVTFGCGWVFWALVSRLEITGGHDGISGIPRFSIGSFVLNQDYHLYYLLLVVVCIIFLLNKNLVNSKLGKETRAMDTFTGGSILAAKSLAVDTGKIRTQLFALAATYAAIAGSIYAHYITHIHPHPSDLA
ncbi:branched-chain amino acid ABC transporter permease [Chloroflexota bacterium]